MLDSHKTNHHSGFGAGVVLGLLGGLFAYFLYDTPEGQDLKRRFEIELEKMKADRQPSSNQPLPSVVANALPDHKPRSFMSKISQLFSTTPELSQNLTKPKKTKRDTSRRYFIRKSSN